MIVFLHWMTTGRDLLFPGGFNCVVFFSERDLLGPFFFQGLSPPMACMQQSGCAIAGAMFPVTDIKSPCAHCGILLHPVCCISDLYVTHQICCKHVIFEFNPKERMHICNSCVATRVCELPCRPRDTKGRF